MATELELNGALEITEIAADWNYRDSKPDKWPDHPRIASIQFDPGAADDELYIAEQEAGGPQRFYVKCENTYDQRIKYYNGSRVQPFILFASCNLSAGHKVTIELWRES